ncbi:hypothetical protein ABZ916_36625 [Streptomyces sp. NPDC046853]|uniref:hypothetical protein n=1 Tax=Streptomyces sp. NPDC046853 TaxID=3154920 RepID=UPI0033EE582B
MLEQDWDDDTQYHRAVGCTWIMVVLSLFCCLLVIGLVAAAIFGADIFLDLAESLSG